MGDNIPVTLAEKLQMGLFVTILCMAIVFLVLIVLSFVIRVQRAIIEKLEGGREEKPAPMAVRSAEPIKPAFEKVEEEDDEELIAVISAAVSAVLGRPASKIIVRSIRRLDSKAPSWNIAGRQDQIGSRF